MDRPDKRGRRIREPEERLAQRRQVIPRVNGRPEFDTVLPVALDSARSLTCHCYVAIFPSKVQAACWPASFQAMRSDRRDSIRDLRSRCGSKNTLLRSRDLCG